MKKFVLVLSVLWLKCAYTQQRLEIIKIKGEADMEVLPTISVQDARIEVMEIAKQRALANYFGTNIQVNKDKTLETKNGEIITDIYSVHAQNSINGEWLKTTDTTFKLIMPKKGENEKNPRIYCKIEGEARKVITIPIQIVCYPLAYNSSEIDSFKIEELRAGQDLFLYFKTPVSGYISVFCTIKDSTYCLLPYPNARMENCFVQKDKDYVLFRRKYDYFNDARAIEEYQAFIDNPNQAIEYDNIHIIFSPSPFYKPKNMEAGKNLPIEYRTKGFKRPSQLSKVAFEDWLYENRIVNDALQIRNFWVKIISKTE